MMSYVKIRWSSMAYHCCTVTVGTNSIRRAVSPTHGWLPLHRPPSQLLYYTPTSETGMGDKAPLLYDASHGLRVLSWSYGCSQRHHAALCKQIHWGREHYWQRYWRRYNITWYGGCCRTSEVNSAVDYSAKAKKLNDWRDWLSIYCCGSTHM